MRYQNVISRRLMVILPLVLAATLTPVFLQHHYWAAYRHFHQQSESYYVQIASECDLLLKEYPQDSVGLEPDTRTNMQGWFRIPIAGADLPHFIRVLHPDYIIRSTNRLALAFHEIIGPCWEIDWGQDYEPRTNTWVLRSFTHSPYMSEREEYALHRR